MRSTTPSTIGHFSGVKSGHMHTNELLRKLMADETAYEIITMDEAEKLSLKTVQTKVA